MGWWTERKESGGEGGRLTARSSDETGLRFVLVHVCVRGSSLCRWAL